MRQQLKMGYIRPEDHGRFIELVNNTPGNLWDPGILKYPTLRILHSYGGPSVFLPMQQVLMLESLAVEQSGSAMENAQAFKDLVKGAEQHASASGIRELWFTCRDEGVLKVAEGHGFERIEWPVVRMKL